MTTYSVYFAGDLFDHKHLAGNELLAGAIDRVSDGRYACVLPQDLEQSSNRMADIRNQDLRQVMACDLGLFNFDGADLDSGTVVEFNSTTSTSPETSSWPGLSTAYQTAGMPVYCPRTSNSRRIGWPTSGTRTSGR